MKQRFGSQWTAQKLGVVSDYSSAWAKIMHSQGAKWGWRSRYIDVFSGAGSYEPKRAAENHSQDMLFDVEETPGEQDEIKKGSATLAMEILPPFQRIDLIERNYRFADALRELAADHLDSRVFVHCDDANTALPRICDSLQDADRAIIFVDPFGCQVWWETLEAVAKTPASDVFYLFPTMGVYRNISDPWKEIPPKTADNLDRLLGTDQWRSAFHRTEITTTLFGEVPTTTRNAAPTAVEAFFLDRLKTVFAAVHPDCLRLKNSRNGHMFSLCFAMTNKSPAAQRLAMRITADVMKKWEGKP